MKSDWLAYFNEEMDLFCWPIHLKFFEWIFHSKSIVYTCLILFGENILAID